MSKKAAAVVIAFLSVILTLCLNLAISSSHENATELHLMEMGGDALIPPDMINVLGTLQSDPSPGYNETSEFLIGSVSVGIIFVESNGDIDPETENWNSSEESLVYDEIMDGTSWLANQNPDADISFSYDIHYRVPVGYEPINRPHTDEELWIDEAMEYLGYPGPDIRTQTRDYINDLRDSSGTDWSFAIFVVDSYNDPDGSFTDWNPVAETYWYAWAYLGGPFLVMTYDNNRTIADMDRVTAHETCHIFWATDEYNGETEYSGYLNHWDIEGSDCLMDDEMALVLSGGTVRQLGWRDSDGDDIQDIVDTFPDTVLNPYTPDPTTNPTLTYTGTVTEVPYPNNNPNGTGRDITINTITNVEFRVDGGIWQSATADDGLFDETEEVFSFTAPLLFVGIHTIEARGINSIGNSEESYAFDEITIRGRVHNLNTGLNYTMIQHAINALETVDGHTIKADPATYNEHVVVNKSVLLIGEDRSHTSIEQGMDITADNAVIDGFTILHNGINVQDSHNSMLFNNTIEYGGISIASSSNNSLRYNHIFDPSVAISLRNSSDNVLDDNFVEAYEGVMVISQNSLNNSFVNNDFSGGNPTGSAFLYDSSFNFFSYNDFHNVPVRLDNSSNNTFLFNHFHFSVFSHSDFYFEVRDYSCNNTIAGNKFVNVSLTLSNSHSNNISRNNITGRIIDGLEMAEDDKGIGIYLYSSSSNRICENDITNNENGICLEVCSHNSIVENNIVNNGTGMNVVIGLFLDGSSYNTMVANNITNNGTETEDVIGIFLDGSSYNTMVANNITDNDVGISLWFSPNNSIYHNNFVNNQPQASSYDSMNTWDNGHPSGGNYWSDYTDVDLYSGPYQNETGSDDMWDHPYVIDEDNQDSYPLVNPWIGCTYIQVPIEGGESVTIISNVTITHAAVTESTLHFDISSMSGVIGWVNVTFPMINTTNIKVFIDGQELIPPPYPITTYNDTHYFIYFELTLSTHTVTIEFGLPEIGGGSFEPPMFKKE